MIFAFDVKVKVDCTACTAPDLKVEMKVSNFQGSVLLLDCGIKRRANTRLHLRRC